MTNRAAAAAKTMALAIRGAFSRTVGKTVGRAFGYGAAALSKPGLAARLVLLAAAGALAYGIYAHPPVQPVARGEGAVRLNQWSGASTQLGEGLAVVVPGLHTLRRFPLRDQTYRAARSGEAPFQSAEGLSLGVDLSVRYAYDQARLPELARKLSSDVQGDVVGPAVQGVIYQVFTRYTVREIFSTKRAEIQAAIETQLKPKLAADGILLRSVAIGKVELPEDFKAGMEKLLAEELESEKMRYTLELKEKQVKQSALEADAEKVRREKQAEAAASEQVIAARAQEEAMRHVLPFKQKQVEQRRLEAEAEKTARIKTSEGNAQARVIEATGEAESRRKLADAEAYRQDALGKASSAQMEREGALLSQHPLLIQKTMADKLSDKVQVIIAAPPAEGGFIGSALLGQRKPARETVAADGGEN
ncbi:SPFH domain-containing protein [Pseudoduganella aquatica]|nr:SPFH domain-containing protein [Pseudoduganella aquatica]